MFRLTRFYAPQFRLVLLDKSGKTDFLSPIPPINQHKSVSPDFLHPVFFINQFKLILLENSGEFCPKGQSPYILCTQFFHQSVHADPIETSSEADPLSYTYICVDL